MKEIECGGCKEKYSDEYEYCPYCGTRNGQFKLIKYKDAIKEKKTRKVNTGKFLVVALIIAAIAGLIVATGMIMTNTEPEHVVMPDTELGNHLRFLEDYEGVVDYYLDSSISVTIRNKGDIGSEIIAQAKNRGFVIDAEESAGSYLAFDDEGCQLVIYDYDDDEISIYLDGPIVFMEMAWPTAGIGALLPEPASMKRHYNSDASDYFSSLIGETTKEDMQTYIDLCLAAGFDVDYYRSNDYFSAENKDGYTLNIYYRGFNTMAIDLYE